MNKWTRRGLAFGLPLIVMAAAWFFRGIWPFGDQCAMIIDSYHQYVPFFSEFQYKLTHGESLLYSWHGSLGYNFWSVLAYYLASPLNVLIPLFPHDRMIQAFQLLIILKISLCGLTCALYLEDRGGRQEALSPVFSAFYALGGFMTAYNWNVMWLDCVWLFPLIVLGAEKLIKKGDGRLYTVTLGLAVISNYYMAIMILIFLILYFFVCWFSQPWKKEKRVLSEKSSCPLPEEGTGLTEDGAGSGEVMETEEELQQTWTVVETDAISGPFSLFLRRGIRYFLCTVLALGLAAVFLLPTVYTMANSSTGYSPSRWELYRSFLDMFAQHFAMLEPTQLTGAPNIYCGVCIFMLAVFSLGARQVPLRERILKVLLAAFLFVSLNVNVLAYVWHGLHFPNNLPGRFSFIYIFLLVVMAWDAFRDLPGMHRLFLPAAAVVAAGWYLICLLAGPDELSLEARVVTGILTGAGLVCLLAIPLTAGRSRTWMRGLTAALMTAELFANTIYGINANGSVTIANYMAKTDQMEEIRRKYQPEDTFYRMESAQILGRDDIVRYNMNGLSYFSSTCDDRMETLMGALGFYNAGNKYSYKGATPLTDAMLGIRYVISDSALPASNLEEVDQTEDLRVYENQACLPLGYMTEDEVLDWTILEGDPFMIQNDFARLAGGTDGSLFKRLPVPDLQIESGTVTSSGEDRFHYESQDEDTTVSCQPVFDKKQDVYLYFEASHCKELKVTKDGEEKKYSDERGHIVHLGLCGPDTDLTLEFPLNGEDESGTIVLQLAAFDEDVFDQVQENLSGSTLEITSASSPAHLSGTMTARQDGILLLSIPFDRGWRIRVDGEVQEPFAIGEALTGIRLESGFHRVALDYRPQGFAGGLALSILSLAVLLILFLTGILKGQRRG